MNKFINPEENRDIQSNNTEITKRNEIKKENNSGDNKSNVINSQNEKKLEDNKEEIDVNNERIKENESEKVNDDNVKTNSNNSDKFKNDILVDNEKETEDINSNNNNNNDNFVPPPNNKKLKNKPYTEYNNNIASNSKNYINLNHKMNSSYDLSKNFQNDEPSNNQNQINRNTTNIFSNNLSIQNLSNIKKNDQLENDDNLPMLLDKFPNKITENDINDNNNLNNNGEYQYQDIILEENGNIEQNGGFEISNGRKFSDRNNNILINNNTSNGKLNYMNFNFTDKNQGFKGENNIAVDDSEREIINKSPKEKSEEESNSTSKEKDENKIRMSTEEFLEKNLEEDEPQKNETEKDENNKNISNPEEDSSSNESEYDESKEPKKERIYLKQIIPINYIEKKRQKEFKINKKIPKKKRVFITKTPAFKEKEVLIPIIPQCYISNQYIIQKNPKLLVPIISNYFFQTKLTNYKLHKKKSFINKLPKIYKKIIVSPGKTSLFCIRHKNNNKFESIINIEEKGNTIDINFQKSKNKTKKINIISKDKDTDDYTSSQNDENKNKNKGPNIVIKDTDNIIKKITQDASGNNIDISIQFSNKTPSGTLGLRNIRNFPFSANKKKPNIKESLYKDLRDIKNKLKNKEDYLKKNYYNLHYQKHFGDEKNCYLCQEMRQKGLISQKEKGINETLSLRNSKDIKHRPLSKLRISVQQKTKDKNIFRTNNIEAEFKNKYLQFNGLNRPSKLIRYGSSENLTNTRYENDNKPRNFRLLKLNMDKDIEKNREEDNLKYQTLKHYFNKKN